MDGRRVAGPLESRTSWTRRPAEEDDDAAELRRMRDPQKNEQMAAHLKGHE